MFPEGDFVHTRHSTATGKGVCLLAATLLNGDDYGIKISRATQTYIYTF